jgi:hypothetical protein
LALVLVLLLDAVRRGGDRRGDLLFRALAGLTIALLVVVMVSAVQRMRLYVDEFGLSELRLYTTVFMVWLAIVFAWFCATTLRGEGKRFAIGALGAAFATLLALNALNPDALIARVNLERPPTARPVDVDYLLSLSADAAPTLITAIASLPGDQGENAGRVLQRWTPPDHPDWRTYNTARDAAWEETNRNRGRLEQLAGPRLRAPERGNRRN